MFGMMRFKYGWSLKPFIYILVGSLTAVTAAACFSRTSVTASIAWRGRVSAIHLAAELSGRLDKPVDDLFIASFLEINAQFAALNRANSAIAKFLMKNSFTIYKVCRCFFFILFVSKI